jgi:fumarate reductase subunit C
MSERRPYRRPMRSHWWAHKPYRAYTARELSGLAVAAYGGVVFAGLVSLWRGLESYEAYLRFLKSPESLVLHAVLLAAMLYHMVTWFQTLPKTQPKLIVGGKPFPQPKMTALAILAGGACSLALVGFTIWVAQ